MHASKIRCDEKSWKIWHFKSELNRASPAGCSRQFCVWPLLTWLIPSPNTSGLPLLQPPGHVLRRSASDSPAPAPPVSSAPLLRLRLPRGAGAGSARSRPLQISPAAGSVGLGRCGRAKLGCVPGDGDAAGRCVAPGGRLRRVRRSEVEPGLCSSPRIKQLAGRVIH